MRFVLVALFILATPTMSNAGLWNSGDDSFGVGYLARANGTKIFARSEGDAVTATVNKDFPFVAYAGSEKWLGIMAAESIVNGRVNVRYWKNGINEKDGENTAWVDLKEVERIQFDCCGDSAHCSGFTSSVFKTRRYTDCFIRSAEASISKRTVTAGSGAVSGNEATELEKMKLQVEIEKLRHEKEIEKLKLEKEIEQLKLEQERLKAGVKQY
ncbi:MAG: hypothetical protein VB050_12340 [Geobacteraceae bacterium]|nr:hypothetical protein [Geobacteraceae bacterium]